MNALERFLNQIPPYVRIMLAAIVPAAIVLVAEETKHARSLHMDDDQPVAAVHHTFTAQEMGALSITTGLANQLLQSLDKQIMSDSKPTAENELACLGIMRNATFAYSAYALNRLQEDMGLSLAMKNEDDERLVSANIIGGASVLVMAVPVMNDTLKNILTNCTGNVSVGMRANQMSGFITSQLTPILHAIQAHDPSVVKAAEGASAPEVPAVAPVTAAPSVTTVPSSVAHEPAPAKTEPQKAKPKSRPKHSESGTE
jgi:hypothetical protein